MNRDTAPLADILPDSATPGVSILTRPEGRVQLETIVSDEIALNTNQVGRDVPAIPLSETLALWQVATRYNRVSAQPMPVSVPRALAGAVPLELTARIMAREETPCATPRFRAHLANSFRLISLRCLVPSGTMPPPFWPLYLVADDAEQRIAILEELDMPLPPYPFVIPEESRIASAFVQAVLHRDAAQKEADRTRRHAETVAEWERSEGSRCHAAADSVTASARATMATAQATMRRGGGW